LLKSRVRNFGRMGERRGVVSIGVTYGTPVAKVKRAGEIIQAAIGAQKSVRLERCYLKDLGAAAMNFEAVYFVADGRFDTLVAVQQDVNFRILAEFEREGIEFAYPAQTAASKS
jgi:small-conductance mechanosensitive channel